MKFSFEIAREAKNQQTLTELNTVKKALHDYKSLYGRSVDKLKEADIKNSEVESKLEALQTENSHLKRELGSRALPANNKTCELRETYIQHTLHTYISNIITFFTSGSGK